MASVALVGITKSFGRRPALSDINLEIRDGEFLVIVGPSGCGKSTLLRIIAGLEESDNGEVMIGGERVTDWPPARRGVAMVFQSYALYPHMTAFENMRFGLKQARIGRAESERRVRRAAEILRISHLLDRKPRELSGGERQRVAIGRAITREAGVFLLDEPLSNLDAGLRGHMRAELLELQRSLKVTTIHVTHDQVEAMTLADRIAVLRNGRIEQVGPPLSLYHRPANQFVGSFIGAPQMNFIPVDSRRRDGDRLTVALPGGADISLTLNGRQQPEQKGLVLGIRPEHLHGLAHGPAQLTGRVHLVEHLGNATVLHIRCPQIDADLRLQASGTAPWQAGDEIAIGISAADCTLFDSSGIAVAHGS
ncbi:MAG TPA: ATP-binding cassette domain-containing protein [Alphaproteobacteria bacterium]|nr:ATP-binding cassette domain-containing protein [Alphaproteobacteria bacterium]